MKWHAHTATSHFNSTWWPSGVEQLGLIAIMTGTAILVLCTLQDQGRQW